MQTNLIALLIYPDIILLMSNTPPPPFTPGVSGNPTGRPQGASARAKVFQKIMDKPVELRNQAFGDVLFDNACLAALGGDKDWMMFFLSRVAPAIPKKDELDEHLTIKQIELIAQKIVESKLILVFEQQLKEIRAALPQLQNQQIETIEYKEETTDSIEERAKGVGIEELINKSEQK